MRVFKAKLPKSWSEKDRERERGPEEMHSLFLFCLFFGASGHTARGGGEPQQPRGKPWPCREAAKRPWKIVPLYRFKLERVLTVACLSTCVGSLECWRTGFLFIGGTPGKAEQCEQCERGGAVCRRCADGEGAHVRDSAGCGRAGALRTCLRMNQCDET